MAMYNQNHESCTRIWIFILLIGFLYFISLFTPTTDNVKQFEESQLSHQRRLSETQEHALEHESYSALPTNRDHNKMYDIKYYESQAHQDETVNKLIFNGMTHGFFMEFGAGDGKSFSNSYFFEKQLNWNGVLIEPVLKHYLEIKDVNQANRTCACVHGAICTQSGQRTFLDVVTMQGWSGFEDEMSINHLRQIGNNKNKINRIEINCYLFDQIIDIFNVKVIDYLIIDIEGYELSVLKTIPFHKIPINVVQIELNQNHEQIRQFMLQNGYDLPWRIDENHYDDIFVRKGQWSQLAKQNAKKTGFKVGCNEGMGCRKVLQCPMHKIHKLQCTQGHKIV